MVDLGLLQQKIRPVYTTILVAYCFGTGDHDEDIGSWKVYELNLHTAASNLPPLPPGARNDGRIPVGCRFCRNRNSGLANSG